MAKFEMTDECAKILASALIERSKLFIKHAKTMQTLGQAAACRDLKKEALRLSSIVNDISKAYNLVSEPDEEKEKEG